MHSITSSFVVLFALVAVPSFHAVHSVSAAAPPHTLTVVVMDPLSAPLSCPCVEGYAQRKYEVLAKYLEQKTGEDVRVVWDESLTNALNKQTQDEVDLIIGKDSVVRSDAALNQVDVMPIAQLTDKKGETTQTGLIVVPSKDPAKSVKDLQDYRILFGPVDSDEKHSAAIQLLKSHNITLSPKPESCQACSEGAVKILEWGSDVRGAAVISSYAAPLLEGCGTIRKGDLRVVGKTKPVPFITAFATDSLEASRRKKVQNALTTMLLEPEVCQSLETLLGFVEIKSKKAAAAHSNVSKKKLKQ